MGVNLAVKAPDDRAPRRMEVLKGCRVTPGRCIPARPGHRRASAGANSGAGCARSRCGDPLLEDRTCSGPARAPGGVQRPTRWSATTYGLADEDASDSTGGPLGQVRLHRLRRHGDRQHANGNLPHATQKQAIAATPPTSPCAATILEDKYNHLVAGHPDEQRQPKWIENWFATLWAYNSGVQPRDAEYGNTTGRHRPRRAAPIAETATGAWAGSTTRSTRNTRPTALPSSTAASTGGSRPPRRRQNRRSGPPGEGDGLGRVHRSSRRTRSLLHSWSRATGRRGGPTTSSRYQPAEASAVVVLQHHEPLRPVLANPCLDSRQPVLVEQAGHLQAELPGHHPSATSPGTQYVSCGQESIRHHPGAAEPYADWNAWFKSNCSLTGVYLRLLRHRRRLGRRVVPARVLAAAVHQPGHLRLRLRRTARGFTYRRSIFTSSAAASTATSGSATSGTARPSRTSASPGPGG